MTTTTFTFNEDEVAMLLMACATAVQFVEATKIPDDNPVGAAETRGNIVVNSQQLHALINKLETTDANG